MIAIAIFFSSPTAWSEDDDGSANVTRRDAEADKGTPIRTPGTEEPADPAPAPEAEEATPAAPSSSELLSQLREERDLIVDELGALEEGYSELAETGNPTEQQLQARLQRLDQRLAELDETIAGLEEKIARRR